MKKLINIKTAILTTMGVLIILLGTSCLKEDDPSENYSHSPALISFQYSGFSAEPFVASLYGQATDSFPIEVTLSVASLTLNSAVTATIAADQTTLDSFNSANGSSYVQLSSGLYTLPNNGTVTINPGQQIVSFTLHFSGDQIDFDQANALALKITDANGAVIATNLSTAILLLTLRNPYEGNYTCTGYFVHPSAPRGIAQTGYISTITLVTSVAPLGDLGGWEFYFDTDPVTGVLSNWVAGANVDTYGPDGSGFLYDDNLAGNTTHPGPPYESTTYNNTYDAATQTFWMHYGYNGGGGVFTREIYEKYQRQ